ncbi:hypothetical protein [Subtercola vilae]|uniref:Uncharacterized protein n=1 Tax=Subtercola vilae TaxID=2056433 RepID=A0A4V4RCP0_9MICO|nr:hypothetical protein [Subtercola vilae]TIH27074.1 hypothetical protein D4765_18610 [Subtercola vilae]
MTDAPGLPREIDSVVDRLAMKLAKENVRKNKLPPEEFDNQVLLARIELLASLVKPMSSAMRSDLVRAREEPKNTLAVLAKRTGTSPARVFNMIKEAEAAAENTDRAAVQKKGRVIPPDAVGISITEAERKTGMPRPKIYRRVAANPTADWHSTVPTEGGKQDSVIRIVDLDGLMSSSSGRRARAKNESRKE